MTKTHHAIDYIEWAATDLAPIKDFYAKAFGWSFIDYGPTYAALDGAGLDGGFEAEAPGTQSQSLAKPLVILYSENLEQSREDVLTTGGVLTVDIFDFPGGRRFQFSDLSGNELGVWSDK